MNEVTATVATAIAENTATEATKAGIIATATGFIKNHPVACAVTGTVMGIGIGYSLYRRWTKNKEPSKLQQVVASTATPPEKQAVKTEG